MTQTTENLKTFIQDSYSKAQLRLVEFKERAQATLKDSSSRGRERVEELAPKAVLDLIDRFKALDAPSRRDVLEQLGLASREELKTLRADLELIQQDLTHAVAALRKELAAAQKKLAKAAKDATRKSEKTSKPKTAKKGGKGDTKPTAGAAKGAAK